MKKIKQAIAVALLAGLSWSAPSMAAFPDKPLRMIVPFPAGGAADFMARGMALRLAVELGQPVIIDNRGGAGGAPAAEAVARAVPDGYTLLFGTMGTQVINPALYPKLRYDPSKDFAPISLTHITPRVLVVRAALPVKSIAELSALAKKQPGLLTYSSAGSGSSSHLSGALFESLAKVDLVHVPYKGSAPALMDLLAGRIDMSFDSYTVYEEHIKSGKVRALGVTSKVRMGILPQVPTIAESGLQDYDVSNWLGLLAPAGTPPATIARLDGAIKLMLAKASVQESLIAQGATVVPGSAEELGAFMANEVRKWSAIALSSGASVQ